MKKIISRLSALAIACCCTVTAVFASATRFNDVPGDAYYAEAVEWAVQSGITAGVGGNKFGSNAPCTRGQIMTMLWRAAGSQTHNAAESAFTDVSKGDYYYDAVLWAVENGITAGVGNNKFGPNDPCTRAQVMTFLWKSTGANEPTNTASRFVDVAGDAYYAKAVAWAVENGVTSGVGADKFGPNQTCTRAQIVTFLCKADQITECTEHDFEVIDSILVEEMQLENSVLETRKCKICGYEERIQHDVNRDLSASEIDAIESEVISYVNQFRAEKGLSQISAGGAEWDVWADTRAAELPIAFGHMRPDGSSWTHAIGDKCTAAENVSAGSGSAYGFFDSFRRSPPHRDSMLVEELTNISVGIYLDKNGTTYCAMVLIEDC